MISTLLAALFAVSCLAVVSGCRSTCPTEQDKKIIAELDGMVDYRSGKVWEWNAKFYSSVRGSLFRAKLLRDVTYWSEDYCRSQLQKC